MALPVLAAGTWYSIPGTSLTASGQLPANSYSPAAGEGSNYVAIMTAWSSGAYDSLRGRLLVHGGGHGDYPGNEVYAFDLATAAWTRIYGPSYSINIGTDSGTNPDGTPASVHTWGGLAYVSSTDSFYRFNGSKWGQGGDSTVGWRMQLATSPPTFTTTPFCDLSGLHQLGNLVDFDPNSGLILHVAPEVAGLHSIHPSTGVVNGSYGPTANAFSRDSINFCIDPVHRKALCFGQMPGARADGGNNGQMVMFYYDLSTTPPTVQNLTLAGDTADVIGPYQPDEQWYAPGLTFDSAVNKIAAWNGGRAIYHFDMSAAPTVTVTKLAMSLGSTPGRTAGINTVSNPNGATNGTWGRFRYMPDQDLYIAATGVGDTVFVGAPRFYVPPKVWVSRVRARAKPGMFGAGQSEGTKHARIASRYGHANADGKVYIIGGDWGPWARPDANDSSNMTLWTHDLATDIAAQIWPPTAAPWTNKDLGWCIPAGEIGPNMPDESVWIYDSTRDRFYLQPGYWSHDYASFGCTTGGTALHCGLFFSPSTRTYSLTPFAGPPTGGGVIGGTNAALWGTDGNGPKGGVYDSVTDQLFVFFQGVCNYIAFSGAQANVWKIFNGGGFWEQDKPVIDVAGRHIYLYHYATSMELVKFNIDTPAVVATYPMPSTWKGAAFGTNHANLMNMGFDTRNRKILLCNARGSLENTDIRGVYTFDVDNPGTNGTSQGFTQIPIATQSNTGLSMIFGTVLEYDPAANCFMFMGQGNVQGTATDIAPYDTIDPYYRIFRLGGPAQAAVVQPLSASFTTPASGATVNGAVTVTMAASGGTAPYTYALSIDGTVVQSSTATTYSWNTTTYTDASHTLSLTITDALSDTSTVTRAVTVHNAVALSAFFTSPAAGATVSGTVGVAMGNTGGTGPFIYALTIDGALVASSSATTFSWNTVGYSNTSHTLGLTVTDSLLATSTATRTVSVVNLGTAQRVTALSVGVA